MARRSSGTWVAAALALLAWDAAASAQAPGRGRLTVHVEGVVAGGGILRLGVYDRAGYPEDKDPVAFADVPAKPGVTSVTLNNIPPGEYAVMTYQDVNANDRMDNNFIGLPREPYGFSRDAKPFLSKPGFDAVKFTVSAGENTQSLRLQNTGQ